jgi:ParB-like chromosome segregation protein Spo0J
MVIKDRLISELVPAEYNPRQLSEQQFEDLKASFVNLGTLEPAVVNIHPQRLNVIISGHQRVRVAEALGMTTYPCYEVDFSPAKEKEANIRMNANTGSWDFDLLANNFDLGELKEWGCDFLKMPAADADAEKEPKICPECGAVIG